MTDKRSRFRIEGHTNGRRLAIEFSNCLVPLHIPYSDDLLDAARDCPAPVKGKCHTGYWAAMRSSRSFLALK